MIKTLFDNRWSQAISHLKKNRGDEVIEHGWEQHVILDHENRLVYRYPRNQSAADKLVDEVELLHTLHEQVWPVAIPRLRQHTAKYSVYDLIEGQVLTDERLAKVTNQQIQAIGEKLGVFLAQLHRSSKRVVENKKTKQKMTLLEYYAKRITQAQGTTYYSAASTDLAALTVCEPEEQVVVHGDLHGLNIVVNPRNNQLVGVIDFSEVEIGDPHQDFRKLFMTDARLLEPAVTAYQPASGKTLSTETIKHWAYVNEWANVCFFHDNTDHPTFRRAYKNLKKWQRL